MAASPSRQSVRLAEYRPPAFLVEQVELSFVLDPEATIVHARQALRRRAGSGQEPLVLLGEELQLESITVDGREVGAGDYRITGDEMAIEGLPDTCTLEITTRIVPAKNTKLMGLYVSSGIFCTQCEAQGFRRITWFQDRPDVMAPYRVTIEADKRALPVLLSNGNLLGVDDLGRGRHRARWEDPFPKPAYLFALVAGDLAVLEDEFQTRSGRRVQLKIYAEAANIGQCGHAMTSLKKSMRWDEEAYGLEYDLDLFQIVVVNDFNFGAMENKGLNIFNASAALARSDTSTDGDFLSVERIIAHEYFHNWTGNRVTCRDWFQLTLKEGLTVLRDQQFSEAMHPGGTKRIGDVVGLREVQFAEDAGPLAHPIRPDQYVEINNFYTATIYQKGAEIIRLVHTLIGEEAYRRGIDLYFERHDGQAVTCEDFVAAMADASDRDLSGVLRWYRQAGTPVVKVERAYDPATRRLTLEVSQAIPPTPGQPTKEPVPIPIRMGLLGRDGRALPLQLEGENEPRGTERVLELNDRSARFVFLDTEPDAVPSLLRGFSAPVKLEAGLGADELAHLLRHDTDPFARWEAGQALATRAMLDAIAGWRPGAEVVVDARLGDAFAGLLGDPAMEPSFLARALALPGRSYLAQQLDEIPVEALHAVIQGFRRGLGSRLEDAWARTYEAHADTPPQSVETRDIGRRAIKNLALAYLGWGRSPRGQDLAVRQLEQAGNMTERFAALSVLAESWPGQRQAALESFYRDWKHEALVVNKWFALQAGIEDEEAVARVDRLLGHEAFTLANPNRARALIGGFAGANLTGFHRADGAGYRLVMEQIMRIDPRNPQVAARLLTVFGRWRRFDVGRQGLMRAALERLQATPGLSKDCFDIASRSLAR